MVGGSHITSSAVQSICVDSSTCIWERKIKEPYETAHHLNLPFRVCFWAEIHQWLFIIITLLEVAFNGLFRQWWSGARKILPMMNCCLFPFFDLIPSCKENKICENTFNRPMGRKCCSGGREPLISEDELSGNCFVPGEQSFLSN